MRELRDRVAVVTGGAGGLGLGLARGLAACGCHVALVDIDEARLESAAAELRGMGRRVSTHRCDVADRGQMQALPAAVLAAHGAVDILINNAGVSVAGRFREVDLDDMDWLIGVNFWGVVHGMKFFLPLLEVRPEAHIANVCSSFGLVGFAGKSAYGASKFAVRGLTESIRAELAGSAIGVTLVYPGPIATNLLLAGRAADPVQRDAEHQFLTRRALSMARVERRVIRAIQRNAPRVLIGSDYRLIDWLARVSPALAARLTARLARTMPF